MARFNYLHRLSIKSFSRFGSMTPHETQKHTMISYFWFFVFVIHVRSFLLSLSFSFNMVFSPHNTTQYDIATTQRTTDHSFFFLNKFAKWTWIVKIVMEIIFHNSSSSYFFFSFVASCVTNCQIRNEISMRLNLNGVK